MKNIKNIIKKPFFIITVAIIVALVITGYAFLKTSNNHSLSLHQSKEDQSSIVKRMTLQEEVSATGKVKSSENIDLAFERSGRVTIVYKKVGDKVKAGEKLVALDSTDAQKAVKSAELDLENAKLALEKLKLQQERQLRDNTLNQAYEKGMDILTNFYGELSPIIESLDKILFSEGEISSQPDEDNITYYANYFLSKKNSPIPDEAKNLLTEIKSSYQQAVNDFQEAERGKGDNRGQAIKEGYDLATKTAQLIKLAQDTIRPLQDNLALNPSSIIYKKQDVLNAHLNKLNTYSTTINNYLQNLLTCVNTINSQKDVIENQPIDLKTQELIVQQKENALAEARNNLEKCFLYSPIDGTVTVQNAEIGKTVTANVPIVSLISNANFEIESYVSEADIAKIRAGDKALITLDAYGDNEIFEAKVIVIDPAETVINGVNAYKVTLQFNNENELIKSGMTANIRIITAERENVLAVPERAIITRGDEKFVLIDKNDSSPEERKVEVGIKGSNGYVEILSGLNEGEKIISFGGITQ